MLAELVGEDTALALARVAGSSAARLAEALSSAVRIGVEVPTLTGGTPYSEVVAEYSNAGRDLLPVFLDALGAVFRRHLVLVSYQVWSPDEERAAVTLQRTVGFADLVGSTAAVRSGSPATVARMVASMATVPLPAPFQDCPKAGRIDPEQSRLYDELGIEVPFFRIGNPVRRCFRVSAQLYNSMAEYEYLAKALHNLRAHLPVGPGGSRASRRRKSGLLPAVRLGGQPTDPRRLRNARYG